MTDRSLPLIGAVEVVRSSAEDLVVTEVAECWSRLDRVLAPGVVVLLNPLVGDVMRCDVPPLPPGTGAVAVAADLTHHGVREAMAWGARGFVGASASAETLVSAVTAVGCGGMYLEPGMSEAVMNSVGATAPTSVASLPAPRLTPRECDVLAMLAQGLTHKQIGRALGLSKSTVDTYVYRISQKMSGGNKAQLTRLALQLNLVPEDAFSETAEV